MDAACRRRVNIFKVKPNDIQFLFPLNCDFHGSFEIDIQVIGRIFQAF